MKKTNSSYYQITDEILIEYVHYDLGSTTEGDVSLGWNFPNFTGYILDIDAYITKSRLDMVKDKWNDSNYVFLDEYEDDNPITNNHKGNVVFPINASQSLYIEPAFKKEIPYTRMDSVHFTKPSDMNIDCSLWDENETDVWYDEVIVHFTSSKYMMSYEGLILNCYVRDALNKIVNLSSICLDKKTDLYIESTPLMIGSKLYTKNYKFRIPSVDWMLNSKYGKAFTEVITDKNMLSCNSPVTFSLVGIIDTFVDNGYVHYDTEEIKSIAMPYKDTHDNLSIEVKKASDGDYFTLKPIVDGGSVQFSDYLSSLGGNFTVIHDISLVEYYIDDTRKNKIASKVTHKEYFVVATELEGDSITNAEMFDEEICYRPVLKTRNTYYFIIQDTLRIYDNGDNTTIVKTGNVKYGDKDDESVGIYGKYIQPITTLTSQLLRVNVYNKRTDMDLDSVTIKNTNVGKIDAQNNNYQITSFIDSRNIAISSQNVTVSDVDKNI